MVAADAAPGVTEKDMSNFWLLVFICNASTVLPLVLIKWIPDSVPTTPVEEEDMDAAHVGYGAVSQRDDDVREHAHV